MYVCVVKAENEIGDRLGLHTVYIGYGQVLLAPRKLTKAMICLSSRAMIERIGASSNG